MEGILERAINRFERKYLSYSYLMKVNHDEDPDIDMVLRYHYMHPGFVRMDMISPFRGAVLTYDPSRRIAQVRPFGSLTPLSLNSLPIAG